MSQSERAPFDPDALRVELLASAPGEAGFGVGLLGACSALAESAREMGAMSHGIHKKVPELDDDTLHGGWVDRFCDWLLGEPTDPNPEVARARALNLMAATLREIGQAQALLDLAIARVEPEGGSESAQSDLRAMRALMSSLGQALAVSCAALSPAGAVLARPGREGAP